MPAWRSLFFAIVDSMLEKWAVNQHWEWKEVLKTALMETVYEKNDSQIKPKILIPYRSMIRASALYLLRFWALGCFKLFSELVFFIFVYFPYRFSYKMIFVDEMIYIYNKTMNECFAVDGNKRKLILTIWSRLLESFIFLDSF